MRTTIPQLASFLQFRARIRSGTATRLMGAHELLSALIRTYGATIALLYTTGPPQRLAPKKRYSETCAPICDLAHRFHVI